MVIDAATQRVLETIQQRAQDVQRAYTPGAEASFDDVVARRPADRAAIDPLSTVPPQDARFLIAGDRGSTLYTRDGCFAIENATLVGSDGRPILGFTHGNSALGALHVDAVDAALGRVMNARIEPDGSLAYDRRTFDPRTGAQETQRVVVGRVALARFPAATRLIPVDANHGAAPAGVEAHVGRPGDGNFLPLETLRRSGSGIEMDRSLERLEDAYLAFDAMQAARKAQGATAKAAMDLLK